MNASAAPTQAALHSTERAARQAVAVAALTPLLPAHALLWHGEDTVPYECDGLTAYRQLPLLVALLTVLVVAEEVTAPLPPVPPLPPAGSSEGSPMPSTREQEAAVSAAAAPATPAAAPPTP